MINLKKESTKRYKWFGEPLGYACDTLINGNISHCIDYLRHLNMHRMSILIHKELCLIKEHCPDRYDYVLNKLGNKTNSSLNVEDND